MRKTPDMAAHPLLGGLGALGIFRFVLGSLVRSRRWSGLLQEVDPQGDEAEGPQIEDPIDVEPSVVIDGEHHSEDDERPSPPLAERERIGL